MNTPNQTNLPSDWALPDLFARAGVETAGSPSVPDVRVTMLTDDSRAAKPGACFVAIRGTGHDGHRFLDAAVRAGATAVVVDGKAPLPAGVAAVRVDDTREAMAKLAAAFYGLRGNPTRSISLVGITGTNGKTTMSWLLRSILQSAGHAVGLIGTIEYDVVADRLAAPLTTPGPAELCRHLAAARDAGATYGVLEVSSHALDQRRCDGLSFAAGVFTNLSGDHLDYHGTMERYARAKRRLFDLLDDDGVAVINGDDATGERLAKELPGRVVRYGLDVETADVSGSITEMTLSGSRFVLRGRSFETAVNLPLVGRHNVSNALAAAATAEALGTLPDDIRKGLECAGGVPGRLQHAEPEGRPFSVLVDYCHTDAALEHALRALRPLTDGRLICVFGCGGDRDRSKRPRMAAVVGRLADVAVVTSDNPRTEDALAIIAEIHAGFDASMTCRIESQPDRRRAIEWAIHEAKPGDVVLIAGKGHETYQLVGSDVLPFDDVAVARECLGRVGAAEVVA